MSQAHFLYIKNYTIKFKIVQLYQQRMAESTDLESLVTQFVAMYKQDVFVGLEEIVTGEVPVTRTSRS